MTPPVTTLSALVDVRAQLQPEDRAFVLLSERGAEIDRMTFAELAARARQLARCLAKRTGQGDRVALMFLSTLDFVVSFFACQYAGLVAVPMMVPRRNSLRDDSTSILNDCGARIVLTNRDLITGPRGCVLDRLRSPRVALFTVEELLESPPAAASGDFPSRAADTAFLQYTSGSTSLPKGVVVSQSNIIANLQMMQRALATERTSTFVSWLPLYHDMGLILAVLNAIYAGALCVLMSPVTFVQRPLIWLRAIQDYRAAIAGAPNFGYDHCVDRISKDQIAGLDLSSWRIAFNASEPIRPQTVARFTETFAPARFAPAAMFPCYGLAEATLMVTCVRAAGRLSLARMTARQKPAEQSASADRDAQEVVGCGHAFAEEQLAIVDPQARMLLSPGEVGEIWVRGPNVASGYWNNPAVTEATFHATLSIGSVDGGWLRTGDLGFVDERGELFICGRIKDVIIIRGVNFYPQDIEATVQQASPALRRNCTAVFADADARGRDAIVIVQEVERTSRNNADLAAIEARIREVVIEQHELPIRDVLLIGPGGVPKTTSGKIKRNSARALWRDGAFERLN